MDELSMIEDFRRSSVKDALDESTARTRLIDEIRLGGKGRAPKRHGSPRGRLVLLAAAVVALALAASLVPVLIDGGRSPAAATLRALAVSAANQPYEPVEPGQFLYTSSVYQTRSCDGDGCEHHRSIWIAPNGSGRLQETIGRQGQPGYVVVENCPFPANGLLFEDLSRLPTDEVALRAYIENRAASVGPASLNGEMFTVIGDLLRETAGSPQVRSELFDIASTLPDSVLVGETTDATGRAGVGVGYWSANELRVLIFDRSTSRLLGERTEDRSGRVLEWSVVLRSDVVDSIEPRPLGEGSVACG